MKRRKFIESIGLAALVLQSNNLFSQVKSPAKFFSVEKRFGRFWFITPDDKIFFSLGLNHIDSAPLRYEKAGAIWKDKYHNSTEEWLKKTVAPDLKAWGFNTAGWTQDAVVRGPKIHRHSEAFKFEEYQWLNIPYCHMLPFSEIHQWEAETRHPDFFSKDFEDWCDYVARDECARMKDDPNLIGYFYSDCPLWIHTMEKNKWKGPLFDPEKLKTESGKKELFDLATQYYKVTNAAIRRYDKNHLILGDRYEAHTVPVPIEILNAAKPFVDVFSFQHFGEPVLIQTDLKRFHEETGKPVLLADSSKGGKTREDGMQLHDGPGDAEILKKLREISGCVGFHLCGGYLRNYARNRALKDEMENSDSDVIAAIAKANKETEDWIKNFNAK